ncbi:proline-specific peptidase [Cerioporus squamosus]|nr:proline-specific peptidase [Cerioporus squamosus]
MTICRRNLSESSANGLILFSHRGETHQTYYQLFGSLSGNPDARTPIVVLHGGPGLSHDCVLPHADLASLSPAHPRAVIFYDQLGNGRSTRLPAKPHSFWSLDLFLDELENPLAHFPIRYAFHVFGHSWGGMMGAEFVVRRHPRGLRRLVIANAPADVGLWEEAFGELLRAFPVEVREGVGRDPDEDKEGFYEGIMQVYAVHGCRVQPCPEDFVRTLCITRDWSIVDCLHLLDVPTLVVNGRYDIAHWDFVVAPLVERIPDVNWVKFEESSHAACWEERTAYMQTVSTFLDSDV